MRSELRFSARSVTKMEYFYFAFAFPDTVVNHDWAVHQFTHLGALSNRRPYPRISAKQIEVIEKRVPESQSSIRIILGDVADDFL